MDVEKDIQQSFYFVWVVCIAPHAYRQGLNKEKEGDTIDMRVCGKHISVKMVETNSEIPI